MESYPRKWVPIYYLVFVLAFLFITVYATALNLSISSNETSSYLDTQQLSSAKVGISVQDLQDPELNLKKAKGEEKINVSIMKMGRKLSGLGSSPPQCTYKCGKCSPCKPVLVRVDPGTVVPTSPDYFPEVWRCKCHNKLYKP